MQFKFLTAAALLATISAQDSSPAECLVKNNCKNDQICIGGCFAINKATTEQITAFKSCAEKTCGSKLANVNEFYTCLVGCHEKLGDDQKPTTVPGTTATEKPTATKKETTTADKESTATNKTTTDKESTPTDMTTTDKESTPTGKATTTTKAPVATTATSNAFKVVPSVFAAFVLAALAL